MTLDFFNNERLILIQYYLLLSLPILIISGPFFSDLVVVGTSIFFLFYVLKNKEYKFFRSLFFKIFITFYFYIIFCSLISDYTFHSLKSSIPYLRFGLLSLSVWLVLEKKPNFTKNLFYIFFLIYIFLAIDGLKQYFTKENLFGLYLASGHRVTSLFGEEAVLGSYLSRLFPLFFGLLILFYEQVQKKVYFYYFAILFIIIDILIFITAERTALFLLNFSALIFIISLNNFKKTRLFTLIISLSAFVLISFYYPAAKIRIVDQTLDQIGLNKSKIDFLLSTDDVYKEHVGTDFSNDQKLYIFSKQYDEIYRTSINIFKDNKIFGIGPKNFRKFCNDPKYLIGSGCSTHPHNTYIQIMLELGIVGSIFSISILILFIFYFFKHSYLLYFKKKPYFRDFEIALLVGIFLSVWPLIPTGNFFNNWISIIYYYPVGFLLWSLKKNKLMYQD